METFSILFAIIGLIITLIYGFYQLNESIKEEIRTSIADKINSIKEDLHDFKVRFSEKDNEIDKKIE